MMRKVSGWFLTAWFLAGLLGCATSGGGQFTGPGEVRPTSGSPPILLELFMDTRPFQEQRGDSGSSLTIETRDRDFSAKPPTQVDRVLTDGLRRRGLPVLPRGAGSAPLILSGEIRHFYGQIQLTRPPGAKQPMTSSFLPANFHTEVQLLATLFDVEHQRVIFRKSFLAARNERHSMSEATSKDAKRAIVALVEACLREAARGVVEETVSQLAPTR